MRSRRELETVHAAVHGGEIGFYAGHAQLEVKFLRHALGALIDPALEGPHRLSLSRRPRFGTTSGAEE